MLKKNKIIFIAGAKKSIKITVEVLDSIQEMKKQPVNKMLETITSVQSEASKWVASEHVTSWCEQSRQEQMVQKAWHMKLPKTVRIG